VNTQTTVAALRRFSRFYTRALGLLDEGLLASGFSLSEVRVLYELAQRDGVAAVDLARELALDSGYLSRILRRFAARGLVRRETHAGDARRSALTLTAKGRKTFAPLEAASSAQAATLVAHLDDAGRAELIEALRRVERALAPPAAARAAAPVPIVLRGPEPGDMGWVVQREGALYAREFGYDASFEALVAEIVARFVRRFDPKWERCWIAEQAGRPVGAVFVVRKSARVAQLRLLHVEASVRGQGIGGRLVDECIRFARERGYRTLMLWTQSHLDAARHVYVARGFVLQQQDKHRSFGKSLTAQVWTLGL
jgi:DNA-binding MarR family transcriptional regulator/N-acetylglutamate synthase-like GNAT family acetyltransferase